MPRKRFTETPVEEPTEEPETANDDAILEESNVEEEGQIEEAPVKKKTVRQLQKEAEKRAAQQVKLDMKVKVKCPVCRRTMSQHCLLYTHKCAKANLEKLPKQTGVKEIEEELEKKPEPAIGEVTTGSRHFEEVHGTDFEEPPSPEWQEVKKKVRAKPKPEVREYVPDPPPLVRHDNRYAYYDEFPPVPGPSLHEQLRTLQLQKQHAHATKMVSPLRNFYRI